MSVELFKGLLRSAVLVAYFLAFFTAIPVLTDSSSWRYWSENGKAHEPNKNKFTYVIIIVAINLVISIIESVVKCIVSCKDKKINSKTANIIIDSFQLIVDVIALILLFTADMKKVYTVYLLIIFLIFAVIAKMILLLITIFYKSNENNN